MLDFLNALDDRKFHPKKAILLRNHHPTLVFDSKRCISPREIFVTEKFNRDTWRNCAKRIWLVLYAGLLALFFYAATPQALFAEDKPWNCDDADTLPQQGMNFCAHEDWQVADKALNDAWPSIRAWAKETDEQTREWRPELAIAEENLLKAQRAWINYRDGHCETEAMKYAGGSLAPLILFSCKASMTRKRTEELLLLLKEG